MCDVEALFSLHSPEWTQLKLLLHLNNRGALRQFIPLPLFEFGKIAWWLSGHFSLCSLHVVLFREQQWTGDAFPLFFSNFPLLVPTVLRLPVILSCLNMNADGLPLLWNICTKRPFIWLAFVCFPPPHLSFCCCTDAPSATSRAPQRTSVGTEFVCTPLIIDLQQNKSGPNRLAITDNIWKALETFVFFWPVSNLNYPPGSVGLPW